MKLIETTGDIMHDTPPWGTMLISVPGDYQMNGLTAYLDREFGISRVLNYLGYKQCPDAIYACPVLVLVAEPRSDVAPSLETVERAMRILKEVCLREEIPLITMPPLFTNYYSWADVRGIIKKIFTDTEISFYVYFRHKERN